MAAIVPRSNCSSISRVEKCLDGMIEGALKGAITLIDDSLHNPDYHELKNEEGEALLEVD